MARKWTRAQRAKFKATMAAKRTNVKVTTPRKAKRGREVRSLMTASKLVAQRINGLARIGAYHQLARLDEEREALLKLFPELKGE